MTERKTFTVRPETKQGDEPGQVVCRFATLNVVDSDGDVTLPGAFGTQTVRMQPHNHDTYALPIGKGSIREDGDDAVAELLINLELGQDHYSALKFDMDHGEPQIEWSYTFDVIDEESGDFNGQKVRFLKALKVHSVDSVFLGAGVGTGTVSVKSRKCETCGEQKDDGQEVYITEGQRLSYVCASCHPPKSFDEEHEHAAASLKEVEAFVARTTELVAQVREKNEQLSEPKREKLTALMTSAQALVTDLDGMLTEPKAAPVVPSAAMVLRLAELRRMQQVVGV